MLAHLLIKSYLFEVFCTAIGFRFRLRLAACVCECVCTQCLSWATISQFAWRALSSICLYIPCRNKSINPCVCARVYSIGWLFLFHYSPTSPLRIVLFSLSNFSYFSFSFSFFVFGLCFTCDFVMRSTTVVRDQRSYWCMAVQINATELN